MKLFLTIVVIGLVCSSSALLIQFKAKATIRFVEDPNTMERKILHQVPIGSSIGHAKEVMEKSNFVCEFVKKGTFSKVRDDENAPGSIRQTVFRDVDFLYCDASKGFIVARRWQVAIVHENGLVKSVSVSTGLIGP